MVQNSYKAMLDSSFSTAVTMALSMAQICTLEFTKVEAQVNYVFLKISGKESVKPESILQCVGFH